MRDGGCSSSQTTASGGFARCEGGRVTRHALARRLIVEALDLAVSQGGSARAVEIEKAIIEAVTRDDFATVASLKAQLAPARAAALTEGVDFDRLCQAICNHDGRKELSNYDAASEQDLARMILVRELGRRPARLGNLEANGVVVVEYGIPFATCRHPEVRQVFPGDTWEALVATLLDMLRTDGVCKIPGLGRYTDFVQRKLLGHPLIKSPRRGTPGARDEDAEVEEGKWSKTPVSLLPAGAEQSSMASRRLDYLAKVLAALRAPVSVTPLLVLEEVWDALEQSAPAGQQQSQSRCPIRRMDEAGQFEVVFHLLRFRSSRSGPLFRCPHCRTSWTRMVANVCPTNHCSGILEQIEPGSELDERDRLVARAVGLDKVEPWG